MGGGTCRGMKGHVEIMFCSPSLFTHAARSVLVLFLEMYHSGCSEREAAGLGSLSAAACLQVQPEFFLFIFFNAHPRAFCSSTGWCRALGYVNVSFTILTLSDYYFYLDNTRSERKGCLDACESLKRSEASCVLS